MFREKEDQSASFSSCSEKSEGLGEEKERAGKLKAEDEEMKRGHEAFILPKGLMIQKF